MLGLETGSPGAAATVAGEMLKRGFIVLPSGVQGDVVGLTPPLVLAPQQEAAAFDALEACLQALPGAAVQGTPA